MNAILSADSVGKRFGSKTVLRSASIGVEAGVTVLLGRNGSGKTTLLSILLGLVEADSGLIRFDSVYLERPKWAWMARRGLAYLPVGGILPGRCRVSGVLRATRPSDRHFRKVVERSGLEGLCQKRVSELSTGERRLAELAWLVLRRPTVVIADEPLRTLSPINRDLARALFRDLADTGAAILVTGHEAEDLLDVADSVQWLNEGYIRDLGSPDQARQDAAFVSGYLGRGTVRRASPPSSSPL